MVELQNKIVLFENMIWLEEKRLSEEKLLRSRQQNAALIEERKAQLAKEKQLYISQHVLWARRRANEQIAVHKEENQRIFLETQAKCLDALKASIQKKFEDFTKQPDYPDWMRKHLKEALSETQASHVLVRKEDMPIIEDICGTKLAMEEMDPLEIGGFILVNEDHSRRLRHTFRSLMQANDYAIGRSLNEWLKTGVLEDASREAQSRKEEGAGNE